MSFDPPDRPLSPPADWPAPPAPDTAGQAPTGPVAGPVRRRRWRPLIHLLLFLGTLVTTMAAGIGHYAGFAADFASPDLSWALVPYGAWYSLTILAILGTHEFGHYFACRYYGIDASLPYFLPAPLPLTGTVGAVIRIRQPIPTKRMLFDIGAAGPIAGFVVAVPALFLGLRLSRVVPLPDDFVGMELGEPLLFQLAAWMVWGEAPSGHSINLHPMGLAAWLGLLVTALNLFPVGQLDGGHIAYAALGRRSTALSLGTAAAVVGLAFFSMSWVIWAALIIAMIVFLGPRHPRTPDEDVPLDRNRRWIALATAAIFILCFTPAPIEVLDLVPEP